MIATLTDWWRAVNPYRRWTQRPKMLCECCGRMVRITEIYVRHDMGEEVPVCRACR